MFTHEEITLVSRAAFWRGLVIGWLAGLAVGIVSKKDGSGKWYLGVCLRAEGEE